MSVKLFLTVLQLLLDKDGNLSLEQSLKNHRNILESNTPIVSEEGLLSKGTVTQGKSRAASLVQERKGW